MSPSPVATGSTTRFGSIARALGAIALAAALLAAADAAGWGLAPLAWVAFAPWLLSLERLRPGWAALSGLGMGLAFTAPLRWTTFAAGVAAAGEDGWQAWAWTFGFFLVYAVPFGLFAGFDAAWLRPRGLRSPWLRAGMLASLVCSLWAPFPFTPATLLAGMPSAIQLAEFGGEPLLLWLMLWSALGIADAAQAPTVRVALRPLATVAVVLSAVHGYGSLRLQALARAESAPDAIRLAALPLQLDLPAHAGLEGLARDRQGASGSALERSRRALERAPSCELVVWPETPLPPARAQRACELALVWSERLGRPLLLQCARPGSEGLHWTAEFFRPDATEPLRHAKSALIPLYERPLWSPGEVAEGAPGSVFRLDDARVLVPALCFELHSRRHLRAARLAGGNVVAHMASFAPFARQPVERWDLAMAQIRAVEFRLPILRAANRGPVGWIDAGGQVRALGATRGNRAECIDLRAPNLAAPSHVWIAPVAPLLPATPLLLSALLPGLRGRRRR